MEDDGAVTFEEQAPAHCDLSHETQNDEGDAESQTEESESETKQPETQNRRGSSSSSKDEHKAWLECRAAEIRKESIRQHLEKKSIELDAKTSKRRARRKK